MLLFCDLMSSCKTREVEVILKPKENKNVCRRPAKKLSHRSAPERTVLASPRRDLETKTPIPATEECQTFITQDKVEIQSESPDFEQIALIVLEKELVQS